MKVGVLRLDAEELERVRPLPQEHAVQISRLPDKKQRTELIERAPELTYREVRRAVDRLLSNPELEVDESLTVDAGPPEPITFASRLAVIADLCRQLVRTLRNLDPVVSADERATLSELLTCLETESTAFRRSGGNDSE
jgi:hypothetical protein